MDDFLWSCFAFRASSLDLVNTLKIVQIGESFVSLPCRRTENRIFALVRQSCMGCSFGEARSRELPKELIPSGSSIPVSTSLMFWFTVPSSGRAEFCVLSRFRSIERPALL